MKKKCAALILVSLFAITLSGCLKKQAGVSTGPVTLTFYGLDDSDAFSSIITKYKARKPQVTVKYKKFDDPADYENLIVNEIAEGQGPDIFYIHNTWLPRHQKKLIPLTSQSLTPQVFSEVFVNVASEDFVQPDVSDGITKKIFALPLYVDTLALYYNKNHFEQELPERGKPAPLWATLVSEAEKFKRISSDFRLERGAIALGRADNIRLGVDALYNFLLQGGVSLYDEDYKQVAGITQGQKYVDLFLSFSDRSEAAYSWSSDIASPNTSGKEVEAFLSGAVSSILAYSDLYQRLDTELKNVKSSAGSVIDKSDVGVMPVPQISSEPDQHKVLAHYYGLGVSRNSKNSAVAWDFIQFATSQESSRAFHTATKRPTARRDLIEVHKKIAGLEPFIEQLGYAASFRIFSDDRFAAFLKDAIDRSNNGQNPRSAFSEAQLRMNNVLKVEAPAGLYPKPKVPVKKK